MQGVDHVFGPVFVLANDDVDVVAQDGAGVTRVTVLHDYRGKSGGDGPDLLLIKAKDRKAQAGLGLVVEVTHSEGRRLRVPTAIMRFC